MIETHGHYGNPQPGYHQQVAGKRRKCGELIGSSRSSYTANHYYFLKLSMSMRSQTIIIA